MHPSDLWSTVKNALRPRLSSEDWEVWVVPLGGRYSRGRLTVIAPSRAYVDYVRDHYLPFLQEAATDAAGVPVTISFELGSDAAPANPGAGSNVSLNPRYTFAAFVPGPSNQFARAAAQSVAENPGRAYNPLFLYGGSGLG